MYNRSIFSKGTVTYTDLDISFKAHPFTGDLIVKTDANAIKQALTNLLYTNFGERPFRPSIGAGLDNLLFEPLDELTHAELQNAITLVINNWEPRIAILDLVINEQPDDNSLAITLSFNIVNISQPQTITVILKRVR